MARYQIVHRTEYGFSDWIDGCVAETRLRPRTTPVGAFEEGQIVVIPVTTRRESRTDAFGNVVEALHVRRRLRRLVVSSFAVVACPGPAAAQLPPTAADLPDEDALLPDRSTRDACRAYAADCLEIASVGPAALVALAGQIHRDITYDVTVRAVGRPVADILQSRRGMCQDYARLAVACLRSYAIPARCVVGYVLPGHRSFAPAHASFRLPHAWFSAFLPGSGWLDFDPTEPGLQADDLLTLAYGASEADVTPVQGRLGNSSATQSLRVEITIDRIDEPT